MKKAVVLGCGSSSAVPGIGNYWGKCDPSEPKNRRTRASLALLSDNGSVIIDTGANFTDQVNRENLSCPDAIFYTHAHGDHICGMDDIRWFLKKDMSHMPIYGNTDTIKELENRFYHLFTPSRPDLYSKVLEANYWNNDDYYNFHEIAGFRFMLLPLDHNSVESCGFRFGNFAYTTDLVKLEDKVLYALKGIDIWMVDAGAYMNTENKAHASIPQIIEWNKIVGAKQVYFTSMPPSMDYKTVLEESPEGFASAYDGLSIDFDDTKFD